MAKVNVEVKDKDELETRELDPTKYSYSNPQFKGKSAPESKKIKAKIFTR